MTDLRAYGLVPASEMAAELAHAAKGVPMFARDGSIRAFALVDADDFEWASERRWFVGGGGYAYRNLSHVTEGRGHIAMHRELLGLAHGDPREGDHINRNKLDNRRSNLRIAAGRVEQLQNQSARKNARSRYRGVSFHRQSQKWRARVQTDKRVHSLGYFKTEQEAASAAAAGRSALMPFNVEPQEVC